jgi:hypothetical protein
MITKQSYKFTKWLYDNYCKDASFTPIILIFKRGIVNNNEFIDEYFLDNVRSNTLLKNDEYKQNIKTQLLELYNGSDARIFVQCIEYLIDENILDGRVSRTLDGLTIIFNDITLTSAGIRIVESTKKGGYPSTKEKASIVFNTSFSVFGGIKFQVDLIERLKKSFGWVKSKIFRK